MKTIQSFFIAGSLMFSAFTLQAQSWTASSSNLYLNPTTANVGIGTTSPKAKLHVNGEAFLPAGYSYWIGNCGDSGSRLRLHHNGTNAYIDYSTNLYLRAGTNTIATFDSNGNIGIGTSNMEAKLHINGKLFLDKFEEINGWRYSYLMWAGHSLVMGSPVGWYSHNSIDLKPGGSTQGTLFSQLRMYTATAPNQQTLKIELHSEGNTYFNNAGNFGIGTTTPGTKLDVAGTIRAYEVKVCLNQGCDYVFADDYKLMNINDVANFVKTNHHLPDVAPAAQMESEGINLSEMNALLLRKVEELTLYVIELNKQVQELKAGK